MRHNVIVAVACVLASAAEAQTPRPNAAEVAGPRDEMICRRFVRTGTLADHYRVCKTRGEWDRERAERRQFNNPASCRMADGAAPC